MLNIKLIAIFTLQISLTLGLNADANSPLLKSGQLSSYTEYDDKAYDNGLDRSYSAGSGTVIDNATGLEWQNNVGGTKRNYATTQTYCSSLSLNGKNDWRIPSAEEYLTIFDYGETGPALNDIFKVETYTSYYWSTTKAKSTDHYATAFFCRGRLASQNGNETSGYGGSKLYAMCVRGEQLASQNLSKGSNNTVKDSLTNLEWQDTEDVNTTRRTWQGSIDYCEDLALDNHNDWRLPNIEEMLSSVKRKDNPREVAIDTDMFKYYFFRGRDGYWSSTTYIKAETSAWKVSYDGGYISALVKTNERSFARCVRDQASEPTPTTSFMNPAIINYLLF